MNQFETAIERRNTGSLKWDDVNGALPFWVADMDFQSPRCVLDALKDRVAHGVFGYAVPPQGFVDTLVGYMKQRHDSDIEPGWIVHMGGCVPALANVVQAFCTSADSIMVCSPVYPPIRSINSVVGARIVDVPHVFKNGVCSFDWETMEKAVRPDTRMFVLCNPQNPLGRVFPEKDIRKLAEFCERHDLLLCSDEIHCDLVLEQDMCHFSAIRLEEHLRNRVIVLTAPSKTYNIAGIGYSMALIASPELRGKFKEIQDRSQPPVHCMAYASAHAAYGRGEPWRRELVEYLKGNRDYLYKFAQERLPGVKMRPMEATYLAWLDCSALGLSDPHAFFLKEGGVFLSSGAPFGDPQCVRFNFGTSREMMKEGLERMAAALEKLPR